MMWDWIVPNLFIFWAWLKLVTCHTNFRVCQISNDHREWLGAWGYGLWDWCWWWVGVAIVMMLGVAWSGKVGFVSWDWQCRMPVLDSNLWVKVGMWIGVRAWLQSCRWSWYSYVRVWANSRIGCALVISIALKQCITIECIILYGIGHPISIFIIDGPRMALSFMATFITISANYV